MKRLRILFCVLSVVACWSCSDDDPAQSTTAQGAPFQVMVVFAPNQLGDRSYADNVLSGMNSVDAIDKYSEADSIDTGFITSWGLDSEHGMVLNWAANPVNSTTGGTYERRLLVLTEPFMLPWLSDVKDALRPTDEVLVLKAIDADIANDYGLGDRLHALNISAAGSVRRFCHFADYFVEAVKEVNIDIRHDVLHYYRLYSQDDYTYRDSLNEVLAEEWGSTTSITLVHLADTVGSTVYSSLLEQTLLDAAYNLGTTANMLYDISGQAFAVIDLGSANAGWDLYWLGHTNENMFTTLMLDAEPVDFLNRYCITRRFDKALIKWCSAWMRQAAATMPRTEKHGYWDDYCTDNLPDWEGGDIE